MSLWPKSDMKFIVQYLPSFYANHIHLSNGSSIDRCKRTNEIHAPNERSNCLNNLACMAYSFELLVRLKQSCWLRV